MAEKEEAGENARGREQQSISTGTNSRPRNETISQTGPGIPNDSSTPVEIDQEEEKRIEKSIRSL